MCRSFKNWTLWAGVCCLLFASCTKEYTYITQVDKTPKEEPIVHPQDVIQAFESWHYFGYTATDHLCPSFIMQAKGLKAMYPGSPFIQQEATDALYIEIKNPGEGVKFEVTLKESEVNEETTSTTTIASKDEMLGFMMSVNWKYKSLKSWRRSNLVNLTCEVRLDDKLVERYTKVFTCRSINSAVFNLLWRVNEPIDMDEMSELFGDYPWHVSDETDIRIGIADLMAGYVDEHSPLVEELKKEVILDNYTDILYGNAALTEEELLGSVDAYSYLMQKHGVRYGNKNDNHFQYVRTIDDVFASHQGYCIELTTAFVSWAQDLGLNVGLFSIPGHVYPFVIGVDGETVYPWDPNLLCYLDYPDLSEPSEENFKTANENFQLILRKSMDNYKKNIAALEANTPGYQIVMMQDVRRYIPSLNISESYWEGAARSVDQQSLKLVDRSKWCKFRGTLTPLYESEIAARDAIRLETSSLIVN